MIYLNQEAILYAVSMCKSRRGYQVGIVSANVREIPYIERMIMSCLKELNVGSATRTSRFCYNLDFLFENGSHIYLISDSSNARGKKAHLLVVDEYIDYRRCQEIYRPIECLEDIEAQVHYFDRVNDTQKWVNDGWIIKNPFVSEKEVADVSEDEFLKIIS